MAKKRRPPTERYHLYYRTRNATSPAHPLDWWHNNRSTYHHIACLQANDLDDALALTHAQGTSWYQQPGVHLSVPAPLRESQDGDVLLLECGQEEQQEIWMLLSGRPTRIEPPEIQPLLRTCQQKAIHAVAWSSDGSHIVAGGGQGLARIHRVSRPYGADPSYDTHTGYVQSLAWSPDGTRVATGDDRGGLHIWDVAMSEGQVVPSGRILICREQRASEWYQGIYALAWSPDGTHVATGSHEGRVCLWEIHTGTCVFCAQGLHQQPIRALAWSPEGTHLAAVGENGHLQIWNMRDQCPLSSSDLTSLAPVRALAWSPDGRTIIVGGLAQSVLIVYEALGGCKGDIALSRYRIQQGVYSVSWAPVGDYVVVGCADGSVQVVDLISGQNVQTYHGQRAAVRAVAWSPDGTAILSGSEDTSVVVWPLPASLGGRRLSLWQRGANDADA